MSTSILKYPGGKSRIADWVISHFPAHRVYVEPFFGSGGVFFNKQPSYIETLNDINGDIVNLFKVIRERPAELAAALEFTPYSRAEYVDCYAMCEGDEVERARRVLVRHHQSFGTTNQNKYTWWHGRTSTSPKTAAQWSKLPGVVYEICGRLKDAQIECTDALTLIKAYNSAETLLYLDPPYLQSLRKHNMYAYEMTERQHVELLETIIKSKSKVCLSAYDSALYNEYLKGWYIAEKRTTAQMGLQRTEKLYMNYAPDLLALETV